MGDTFDYTRPPSPPRILSVEDVVAAYNRAAEKFMARADAYDAPAGSMTYELFHDFARARQLAKMVGFEG